MRPKPVRPASKLQLQQLQQQQLWPAASVFEMASRLLGAELALGRAGEDGPRTSDHLRGCLGCTAMHVVGFPPPFVVELSRQQPHAIHSMERRGQEEQHEDAEKDKKGKRKRHTQITS